MRKFLSEHSTLRSPISLRRLQLIEQNPIHIYIDINNIAFRIISEMLLPWQFLGLVLVRPWIAE
jgi:hypothetical protein